jgi:hypothetical protein
MVTKLSYRSLTLSVILFCAGPSSVSYAAGKDVLTTPVARIEFDPAAVAPMDILHAANAIRHPEQYGMDIVIANLPEMTKRLKMVVSNLRNQPTPDKPLFLQMLALSQVPSTHLDLNPLKGLFELRKENQFKPIHQKAALAFKALLQEFQPRSDGLTAGETPVVAAPPASAPLREFPLIWVDPENPARDSIDSANWLKEHPQGFAREYGFRGPWHRDVVTDMILELWRLHPRDTSFAIEIKPDSSQVVERTVAIIDLSRADTASKKRSKWFYIGRGLGGFAHAAARVEYPKGMGWKDFSELVAQHGVIVKRIPDGGTSVKYRWITLEKPVPAD